MNKYRSCHISDIEDACSLPRGYILEYVLTETDKQYMRSRYWSPGRKLIPELVKFIRDKVKLPQDLEP